MNEVRTCWVIDFHEVKEGELAPVVVIASGDDVWLILADEFLGEDRCGTSMEIRHFISGRKDPLPDGLSLITSPRVIES